MRIMLQTGNNEFTSGNVLPSVAPVKIQMADLWALLCSWAIKLRKNLRTLQIQSTR